MEAKTVELVQTSFAKVAPISEAAAEIFYGRLFETNPEVKPLFKGDMKEQGKKLMSMIGTAVGALTNPEALIPVVQKLGKDHAGYGVKAEMYDAVGAALLYTLGKGLGDEFTPDTKTAWTEVYTLLANTMKEAAEAA